MTAGEHRPGGSDERHVVVCEDQTEFRILRAACGDHTVHEWLESWLRPESIGPRTFVASVEPYAVGWRVSAPEREDLGKAVATADALMVEREVVDEALLARAPDSLRAVVCLGTVTKNIDAEACARRGIEVRAVPRPTVAAIAEHVMMLLLVLARGFVEDGQVRADDPEPLPSASPVEAGGHPPTVFNWKGARAPIVLSGRRLGLLGAGETARGVMKLARAFGMEVGYWSRTRHLELEQELGARWVERDALPAWADAVSVHLTYSAELRHIVDASFLRALGPEGILVNCGRGMLVDIVALEEALRARTILGAGLDVFPEEPAVPPALFGLPNVALTPHVAGGSRWIIADDVRELFAALNR